MDEIIETDNEITVKMKFDRKSWNMIEELAGKMKPNTEPEVVRRGIGFLYAFYNLYSPEQVIISIDGDGEVYRVPAITILEMDRLNWQKPVEANYYREWVVRRRSPLEIWWRKLIGAK